MEGERNGRSGIFPTSYVQINTGNQGDSQKMRAIYPFTARSDTELSLKRVRFSKIFLYCVSAFILAFRNIIFFCHLLFKLPER